MKKWNRSILKIINSLMVESVGAVMLWLTMWGCGTATLQISPEEPSTTDSIVVSATDQNGEFMAMNGVAWYRDGVLTVDARLVQSGLVVVNFGMQRRHLKTVLSLYRTVSRSWSPPEVQLTILPDIPTAGYPVTVMSKLWMQMKMK